MDRKIEVLMRKHDCNGSEIHNHFSVLHVGLSQFIARDVNLALSQTDKHNYLNFIKIII